MKKALEPTAIHQKGEVDPLMYTRPTVNGVADPLAYVKPPMEDIVDPLLYTRTLDDGTIDPLIYTKQQLESRSEMAESVSMKEPEAKYEKCVKIHPKVVLKKRVQGEMTGEQENSKVEKKQVLGAVKAKNSLSTNFYVQPVEHRIYFNRAGEEVPDKEEIVCTVYIDEMPHPFIIKTKEISEIVKKVQRRYAEAIIDYREQNASKAIEARFRDEVHHCNRKVIYYQAGWQKIAGVMRYVRDGVNWAGNFEINTGMTLPSWLGCGGRELLSIWRKGMIVYRDEIVMPSIFAFSLMGVLYRPFQDAGIPPHFCLFLHGITGSMKTTIAKIFYVQLSSDRYRENIRRIDADTTVSLERGIVSAGYDTVTLIDDFSPAKTELKKREMADKLEMVIRMVGDGSSRSRSNMRLDDCRGEGVRGMVALTGELTGKGLSSNLRCFYCKIEKQNADLEAISWFQDNPQAYTTLLAAFADYLGNNYPFIVAHIRGVIKVQRERISKILKERRLIDSAAILFAAADIFAGFLLERCELSKEDVEAYLRFMENGIIQSAVNSQIMSAEESPGVVFVQAVAALMRSNKIILHSERIKMTESTVGDGFEDAVFYYFNPDSTHKKAVSFLNNTNKYCPYELREILSIMADEGIIKTAPNGANKRTYCVRIQVGNGAKYNFIKIRKTIFEAICDGTFECGKGEKE